MSKRLIAIAIFLGLCTVAAGLHAQGAASSAPKLPLRMTAWAVNMSNTGTGGNTSIDMRVTKWSTDAERLGFITTFLEKGQDALLKALQSAPEIGRMRYPEVAAGGAPATPPMANPTDRRAAASAASAAQEARRQMILGYSIRYAWHTPLQDGGDRIVLAFDRYVTFEEAVERPRVNDYPFTFIEIHLPKGGGQGEGKMALASKLNFDKKKDTVEFESYASEPVRLQRITVEN